MKKRIFTGAATALVTPFGADGSVNFERLKTLVNEQIDGGIDALVICGTTGEKSTLRYDEHLRVIEEAAKAANGRVPIIAGTGSNDTVYSVELCEDAASVGADAFLMVTPYYNKTSQSGLVAHYNYIADRVSRPIILYNVPSRTGVNIKPDTYKELSKHQNIVATKEASGDLSLGGIGVISVLSNISPKGMHDICDLYLYGYTQASSELFLKHIGLMNAMFCDVNPIPVKEAMNMLGLNVGGCRMPLYPTSEANKAFIKAKLSECGFMI